MAQEVTLLGATYSDVPSILLPDSNSTLHQFTDVTDTTATASDVARGKVFYTKNGTRTTGTSSSGITPTGSLTISSNGTYDVTNYASAVVNVSGGGGSGDVCFVEMEYDSSEYVYRPTITDFTDVANATTIIGVNYDYGFSMILYYATDQGEWNEFIHGTFYEGYDDGVGWGVRHVEISYGYKNYDYENLVFEYYVDSCYSYVETS